MRNLLYKELKLSLHPAMYIFLLLATMMLIPNYPYYVAFMYICLAVFYTFMIGRENKDVFYTALLPVKKRDVVKARMMTILLFELAQIIISIPFAIISVRINPVGNNEAGIEANPAFYGFVFVMYAGFNLIFMPLFYKTAHKLGKSMLFGGIFIMLFIVAVEALAQYVPSPASAFLDTTAPDVMLRQIPILAGGIVVWLVLSLLSYLLSAKRFESVDL